MNDSRTSSPVRGILPRPGHAVKARIISAGLQLKDLAEAAGIQRSTLSEYLSGRLKSHETQVDVWLAFRRLTGSDIGFEAFWGRLAHLKGVA